MRNRGIDLKFAVSSLGFFFTFSGLMNLGFMSGLFMNMSLIHTNVIKLTESSVSNDSSGICFLEKAFTEIVEADETVLIFVHMPESSMEVMRGESHALFLHEVVHI
jgi:hypothetical protein